MLAKLWKKVLLAICIIACLYNIMAKLVNRTSLELNLKSVENGESIFSLFEELNQNTVNTDATAVENTVTQTENTETVEQEVQTEVQNNGGEQSSPITDFVVIY